MADKNLLPLECLADAGRLLGKIDKTLDLFNPTNPCHPNTAADKTDSDHLDESLLTAARRFHQWDGKNTAQVRGFTHCIANEKRKRLVESVIDAFTATLIAPDAAREFRTGINHGDFNDANVLLNNDFHVTGVIDFGDSVERYVLLARFVFLHAHPTRVSSFLPDQGIARLTKLLSEVPSLAPVLETPIRRARSNHGIKAPECQRYHGSLDEWRCFVTTAFAHFYLVLTTTLACCFLLTPQLARLGCVGRHGVFHAEYIWQVQSVPVGSGSYSSGVQLRLPIDKVRAQALGAVNGLSIGMFGYPWCLFVPTESGQ